MEDIHERLRRRKAQINGITHRAEIMQDIKRCVERDFDVPYDEIVGPGRFRYYLVPRIYVTIRFKNELGMGIAEIAHRLNRDHSTIHYYLEKATELGMEIHPQDIPTTSSPQDVPPKTLAN